MRGTDITLHIIVSYCVRVAENLVCTAGICTTAQLSTAGRLITQTNRVTYHDELSYQ
jgi:hypothetical protein